MTKRRDEVIDIDGAPMYRIDGDLFTRCGATQYLRGCGFSQDEIDQYLGSLPPGTRNRDLIQRREVQP